MEKSWDEIWKDFEGLNWFGRRLKKEQRRTLQRILVQIKLTKNARIIDVGCGPGFTLSFFRKFGYKNSIGIDNSKNSLKVCKKFFNFKRGKDVFLMDARNIKFSDKSFDLAFSDSLLEHFEDLNYVVREMCRVARKWILILQPFQTSLFFRLKSLYWRIAKGIWWGEYYGEYFYTKEDYIKTFSKFGFVLVNSGGINFNEQMWLLFKR